MAPSDQLSYQRETLTKLVAGIRPDQMNDPTPCDDWDVRGLVNHFVGGAQMFTAAFHGEDVQIDPDAPTPDLAGDDPLGAFTKAVDGFMDAIDEPGAMERTVKLPFGDMPAPVVLELLKFDLTVHCWDLAQATGQTFEPPADVCEAGLHTAQMMISPELRNGVTFGGEVTVRDTATPIEKLVAFTGRSV